MPGTPEHAHYEGLAAGYALHALEPEDEQRLSAHLLTCLTAPGWSPTPRRSEPLSPICSDQPAPPPGLRHRILDAAAAEPRRRPSRAAPPSPAPLRCRKSAGRSRRPRAEAAPVGAGSCASGRGRGPGGSHRGGRRGAGDAGSLTTGPPAPVALAQALLKPNAQEVTLKGASEADPRRRRHGQQGHVPAGLGLPVNDRARQHLRAVGSQRAGSAPRARDLRCPWQCAGAADGDSCR